MRGPEQNARDTPGKMPATGAARGGLALHCASAPATGTPRLRLTTHLLLTTAVCALAAFLVAMAALLAREHRAAAGDLVHLADTGARLLRTQLIGLRNDAMLDARFPDWSALAMLTRGAGVCVRLEHPDGAPWRSDCRGGAGAAGAVPRWFGNVYGLLFAPARQVQRDIPLGASRSARLLVTTDGEAELARSWAESRRLAGVSAAVVGSLCLALVLAMRVALVPLQNIVGHLEALARGDRQRRLGRLRHVELDRIAQACDALSITLAAHEAERAQFSLRLLEAQERERRQLARDLHDEFGQHLTALAATTATVRRQLSPTDETLDAALARSADSVQHLHGLLRDVLLRLRPPGLDELGLCGAVEALVADWQRRCGAQPVLRAHCAPEAAALPPPLAAECLRIVQECVTNAVRHAAAAHVDVRLARTGDDDSFMLEISDDGRGLSAAGDVAGFGLDGVRERAAACAGRLAIARNASGGTTVRLTIPLAPGAAMQ